MIGYVMLGTQDVEAARRLYDPLMATLGAEPVAALTSARRVWYSRKGDMTKPMVALTKPFDGKAASAGNGTMVALPVRSRETVDAAHAKALSLGATDEGKPGLRTDNFYGAYFRDSDGNKLCIFTMV